MINIAIIGAAGFTGQELLKILSKHSEANVELITSNAYAGQKLANVILHLSNKKFDSLIFKNHPVDIAELKGIDLVFLATPDSIALEWAPKMIEAGIRVIDLGGAFRLKNKEHFEKYYKLQHGAVETLKNATYGFCEIARNSIESSILVANPGCYATAAIGPLWAASEIVQHADHNIIIDAKSGTSGAGGRKEKDGLGFSAVYENCRAYRVEDHQHTPEINQEVNRAANQNFKVRFTPHLLPIYRGILSVSYLQFNTAPKPNEVEEALLEKTKSELFMRYVDNPNLVELRNVQHTNYLDISFHLDDNILILISAIDNLLKGAAGMAVQNMNIMFGFDEGQALIA